MQFEAPGKFYLIRGIPPDLHTAARAKARAEKIPLRAIMLAILSAYVDGDVHIRPGKRRRRLGRRPGVSVHITQPGLSGEAVVQPHRFSHYVGDAPKRPRRRRTAPEPAPEPIAAVAPAVAPAEPQAATGPLVDGIARLRALLG